MCIVQHTCISVRTGTHTIHYEYTYEYLTPCMQYTYALGACKPQVKVATKQTKTISVRLIDFPLIILQITKHYMLRETLPFSPLSARYRPTVYHLRPPDYSILTKLSTIQYMYTNTPTFPSLSNTQAPSCRPVTNNAGLWQMIYHLSQAVGTTSCISCPYSCTAIWNG